jgi:N-acetylmuramoyl-L-alanine amidase
MSVFWKTPRVERIFLTMFTVVVCTAILTGNINAKNVDSDKKTIALDPGHGGYDNGAHGLDGTLEKSVTLAFAKMMVMELKENYNTILTRSDDYWVDAYTRAAMANHSEADVFVSIHTGGSFLHQTNKTSIYFCKQFAKRDAEHGNLQNRSSVNRDVQADWTNIHKRHETTSRLLAKRIQQHLNKDATLPNLVVKGAPLMVLEGADMPAILIELGHITNPAIEKSFKDNHVLLNIAIGIRKGIDDFFETGQQSSLSK